MENKKTFGAYILRRRKELGMTQKEFAEKLYVTESAVSKWERGMSYPDITLLRSICAVLDISEHELLTGSEDTQKRASERLAAKYLRLTKGYRVAQYIIYGAALLACAIGNLASAHTLDWFFIVLTGVMMGASITLAPALAALSPRTEHYKGTISVGCFVLSLELLLLVCCLYTGGDWFLVAGVSSLFGISLVVLPFVLPSLPLPGCLAGRKTSIYLVTELVLLLLLLLVCAVYTGGGWFLIAAVSVVFGLGFFIFPVILWQIPLPEAICRHKALLYFLIQTVFLLLVLVAADASALHISLPITAICLLLPWGFLAVIRYLPVNGWFKAAICSLWSAAWIWFTPPLADLVLREIYGPMDSSVGLWWIDFDFFRWDEY